MPARRGSANREYSRNHLHTAVSCSGRLKGRDCALVPLRLSALKIQRLIVEGALVLGSSRGRPLRRSAAAERRPRTWRTTFRARSWMPALRCPMRLREYSHAKPLPFPHHAELLPHATVSTVRSVVNRPLKHMLLWYIVHLRTVVKSGAHLQCSLGRGFKIAERVRAVGARDGLLQAAKQNRSCRPFQSVLSMIARERQSLHAPTCPRSVRS
jgi:hypothetical protein